MFFFWRFWRETNRNIVAPLWGGPTLNQDEPPVHFWGCRPRCRPLILTSLQASLAYDPEVEHFWEGRTLKDFMIVSSFSTRLFFSSFPHVLLLSVLRDLDPASKTGELTDPPAPTELLPPKTLCR